MPALIPENSPRTHGFTLVEISIVAVIIGFLVGGIMVGTDLLSSARQRKLLSEMERIASAANTFRLRFGCVPGDCTAAQITAYGASFGGANCNGIAGVTGNGYVEMVGSAPAACIGYYNCRCEQRTFADNLFNAGLVQNEFVSSSMLRSDAYSKGMIWPANYYYSQGISDHWLVIQSREPTGNFFMPNDNGDTTTISSNTSRQLDERVDDGNPLIGRVRMISYNGLGVWNAGWPDYGACATSNVAATSKYATDDEVGQNGKKGCRLAFRSSF